MRKIIIMALLLLASVQLKAQGTFDSSVMDDYPDTSHLSLQMVTDSGGIINDSLFFSDSNWYKNYSLAPYQSFIHEWPREEARMTIRDSTIEVYMNEKYYIIHIRGIVESIEDMQTGTKTYMWKPTDPWAR